MQYMCLIYINEPEQERFTPENWQQLMDEHNAFIKDVKDRGMMVGGEALHPTKMASTMRVRSGKKMITDGPFAETKEQLGGYYIIDCKDMAEALEIAAKIPDAKAGSIEVRPIVDFSQPSPVEAVDSVGSHSSYS
jgi:hypothetical protein